jgi:hypothetical protein
MARGDHTKDAAAEEPAAGRSITKTCNQAPVYIRGPRPLAKERSNLLLPPLAEQLEEHCNRY